VKLLKKIFGLLSLVVIFNVEAGGFIPKDSIKKNVAVGHKDFYNIKAKPFFPLVAWNTLGLNKKSVVGQADCGITITVATAKSEMDLCSKYGLKTIYRANLLHMWPHKKLSVQDISNSENKIRNRIKKYKNHTSLYGFQVGDEPTKRNFDILDKTLSVVKKECPNKITYTNIFPNYSRPYQHGFPSYAKFVEEYCDILVKYSLPLLIYDSYANKKTDYGKNDKERICLFLDNLETIRRISLKKNVTFWNTVLSCSHDYYPAPNQWDINLEVFTSLAYGSRGITYFTYQSHFLRSTQGGPIDVLGEKTPIWNYLKICNYQIRTLAPILLKLRSTGVFYSVINADKQLFEKFKKLPGRLIKGVKCKLNRSNLLIGEFKHEDGSDWVMIVNIDTKNTAHFTIKSQAGRKIQSYNNFTGKPCGLDTWLKPGQGKIYKIK